MAARRNTIWLLLGACLLAALFSGQVLFFSLAWLLVGLMVLSWLWAWLSVRNFTLRRQTRAHRAQIGNTLAEVFVLRNNSWLPRLWLEVRDHSNLPGHLVSQVVPAMRRQREWRWAVETPCLARGQFRLGPVTLVGSDPFGLFAIPRHLAPSSKITVYPLSVALNRFDLPQGSVSGGDFLRSRAHFATSNAAGVREYVPGDSFSHIHWRSAARRNRLMVKEFELDLLADIWMLMDFSSTALFEHPSVQRVDGNGPAINTGQLPRSTEEYGVTVCASLATYFIERLDRAVGLITRAPRRVSLQPESGQRQLNRILEVLAVGRSLSPWTLSQVLALETPLMTRGTTLIIVTSSLDTAWVQEARALGRRAISPVCVHVDPQSFGGGESAAGVLAHLQLANIPAIPVRMNDDIVSALSRPLHSLRMR